jgi:hypothetical protein
VTLSGVVVGGLFDVIGTGAGLTICAVVVALVGLWTIRARKLGHGIGKLLASRLRRAT